MKNLMLLSLFICTVNESVYSMKRSMLSERGSEIEQVALDGAERGSRVRTSALEAYRSKLDATVAQAFGKIEEAQSQYRKVWLALQRPEKELENAYISAIDRISEQLRGEIIPKVKVKVIDNDAFDNDALGLFAKYGLEPSVENLPVLLTSVFSACKAFISHVAQERCKGHIGGIEHFRGVSDSLEQNIRDKADEVKTGSMTRAGLKAIRLNVVYEINKFASWHRDRIRFMKELKDEISQLGKINTANDIYSIMDSIVTHYLDGRLIWNEIDSMMKLFDVVDEDLRLLFLLFRALMHEEVKSTSEEEEVVEVAKAEEKETSQVEESPVDSVVPQGA